MKLRAKIWVLSIATLLSSVAVNAAVRPFYQDLKLPTQNVLEHQLIHFPAAANANRLLTISAGDTTGVPTTVSSFLAQPDVPRNLVITPGAAGGNFTQTKAGNVVVTGTDILGHTITESIAVTDGQSTVSTGSGAFATVTSIQFPAENSPFNATWSVGTGTKLGLKRCMDRAGDVAWAELNGVREATMPTMASNQTAVSVNTATLNSALNGNDVDLYFVQNYRCFP